MNKTSSTRSYTSSPEHDECKSCVLHQVCELRKHKANRCKYHSIGYTERKEK